LTDITELARTMQVKTDFVANASHELRTPLSAILAAVETLLSMDLTVDADAARPLLRVVDRQSERLQDLVNDLLDLSRVESPTAQFESEPLDVAAVLAELHARFIDRLEQKQLRWTVAIDPPDAVLLANRQRIILVIDNLVDNAIKFTDIGGRIRVSVHVGDDDAQLVVEDNGCGISLKEQDRVFERFYQVERARSGDKRGTGLGLAIVRHVVNSMKGRVFLTSEPGVGTRVEIRIPQRSERPVRSGNRQES